MDTDEKIRGWFTGRLPAEWFEASPEVTVDREEITIVGRLSGPDLDDETSDAERASAEEGYVHRFREESRDHRIEIASEAERRFRRKVSWGVECGPRRVMFTTLSVPVMTRLRQPERRVLDTLVAGGVAKSRSEALSWCVKLVGQNADAWLGELQEALQHVERVRAAGPDASM